ncbi:hypothetical protein QQP08_000545 [Theobroma cacao]|nr:hypothetical protein QQP08_000545 [Theobroma cacao]
MTFHSKLDDNFVITMFTISSLFKPPFLLCFRSLNLVDLVFVAKYNIIVPFLPFPSSFPLSKPMAYLGTKAIIHTAVKVFAIALLLFLACQAAVARVTPQDHSPIMPPGCNPTGHTPRPGCPPSPAK